MIHPSHLRRHVIRPPLQLLSNGKWSEAAENLLLGIAAQETNLGTYLLQKGISDYNGGIGLYQMEARTHDDLWGRLTNLEKDTIMAICNMYTSGCASRMVWDLRYATLMARMYLWKFPEPLPEASDVDGLANYWKLHWNTIEGAGTVEQFKDNYNRFVKGFENESL